MTKTQTAQMLKMIRYIGICTKTLAACSEIIVQLADSDAAPELFELASKIDTLAKEGEDYVS